MKKNRLENNFGKNFSKIELGRKHNEGDMFTKFCSDWISGSHFIVGTR